MSTLLQDTFTDVDGTLLTVHVMNVGPGWINYAGTSHIESNSALFATLGGPFTSANPVSDAGQADVTVSCDFSNSGSGGFACGLLIRGSDINNWWLCRNSVGTIQIIEINGGSATTQATQAGATTGAHTLVIVCSGNSITASVGVVQANFSSSFNSTVTKFGIHFDDSNAAADNFLVTSSSPPPSITTPYYYLENIAGGRF